MHAGRHRGVHRRAERRPLLRADQVDPPPRHVRVDLHQHRVLDQPAGREQLAHRHARALERLDDLARPERGRLEQRAVHVLRSRRQREPDDQPAQLVVDEDRAVAAVPVEHDQPVLADALPARQLGQVLVQVEPAPARLLVVGRRHRLLDEPAEDVADAALAGLVAPQARDDPAVDDAAHAGHLGEDVAVHDVAGRGAHHGEHLAGLDRLRGGRRHVRVDVADGDRDPLRQAGPAGRLGGQRAGARAERGERHLELGDEVREALVERAQVVLRRPAAVLVDALVAGRADGPDLAAAELPHDPVRALDPALGAVVDLGILVEHLQRLRELPLGRDPPAVARQPRLAALGGDRVDAVGLRLGGVVLPQLRVRVRAVGELAEPAQRRAVARAPAAASRP